MKYIFIYLHFQCFLLLWTQEIIWNSFFFETVPLTYETVAAAAVLNITLLCIKNWYFIAKKTEQFWLSINIRIELYLFLSHSIMKDSWSTCKFRKALRSLRHLHVDPLSFIPPSRMQSLIEMALYRYTWRNYYSYISSYKGGSLISLILRGKGANPLQKRKERKV